MSPLRNSASRRPLSFLFLFCALAASIWGISRVSASRGSDPKIGQPADAQPSLSVLLNPDGTLDLSRGFKGSLNPQGFQMEYAANGAPRFVPAAPAAGEIWDSQFVNANGVQRFGYAVAVIGTDVYLGGAPLVTAGNTGFSNIARWNGSSWSALGSGVNGQVYTLAVSGGDLYVGGDFSMAGGNAANNIARWNGSAWFALGGGVSGGGDYVLGLAVSGSDLYAGGRFTTAGGNPASNIARWNGSAWSALGSGTDQQVVSVAVSGSNVYVGGDFTTAGGNPASFVAHWNGSAWSALGSGADAPVQSVAVSGSNVYMGGSFSNAGGVPANGIARWNGSAWSALGSGLLDESFSLTIRSIVVVGANIYAGGIFTTAGGNPAANIAVWNGSAWSALGSGVINGASSTGDAVFSIAASGSDLYVAGRFTKADGAEANRIARWNGSAWSPLGNASNSVNNPVYAIAVSGNDVYVGGEFDFAGGVAANNIARWNGVSWSALGSGVNSQVFALVVNGTDVYAGGRFTTAGGNPANLVARWNGSAWAALGGGLTNGSSVNALAVIGTNVYASGFFFTAGGNPANNIACWNGSAWSALGSGLNSFFDPGLAMAVVGSDLYVGGNFTDAGGVASTVNIARWNGSAWSALGSGTNGAVRALAVSGSDLYAGGEFTTAGGTTVNKVAKWNGSAWSAMGTGVSGSSNVLTLVATGNDVYAGGRFTTIGGTAANRLARWNGSAWSALGTGADNTVHALVLQGTNLIAGGEFSFVGGALSHYFARDVCVSSLTVNNTGDDPDATPGNGLCETAAGNGVCTLRAAIQEANALAGCSAMTINFSVTGIINTASVLSPIHPNLTLNGPGANQLTVRGAGTHQLIGVGGTAIMLQISGLTLTNGFASSGTNAGAIEFNSPGGMLTVTDCALINNLGFPGAGQIYSNLSGGITISNTVISGNTVGRGIVVDRTPMSLTNTTISNNGGYGLYIFTGDAFSVTLLNCTIANNGQGGIQFSTVTTGNTLVTLKNTIVANNSSAQIGPVLSTVTLTSLGNNLLSDASLTPVAGDLLNANPSLASLGNYGGSTPTRALLPGSPAINAGTAAGAPATDQRGVARAGNVDIGAFESRGFTMAIAGGNNQIAAVNTAFANPLSVTVTSAFNEPVDGGQVTFTSPGSGASCNFLNNPLTLAGGAATSVAAANNVFGGPYSVAAAANGANSVNFQLTNTGPVISSVVLLRTAGAGSSNSTIAQVSDPDQAANTLGLTVNGAASATVNGVTVSGLSISAGGVVTANVEAAVGASSADFSLRVTNSQNTSATATLAVIVTPPACTPVWNSETNVTATDGMPNDAFGTSVAVSGDIAVIGAYAVRGTNNSLAGAAYVFTRNGAIWTQQQKLTPDDNTVTNLFGLSVAISGDTILIGAFGPAGLGGTNTGAGYVFIRNGATWTLQQKLTAPGGVTGDLFGASVALKGDTAVIGAYNSNTPGGSRAGAAYIFTRSGTTWALQQKLTASDGATSDNFGYSVAISGDTVVTGTPFANTAGGGGAGAAYIFTRSGTTWTQQQKLTASDGALGDNFGYSATISGETTVIGARNADTAGGGDAGAAYVFTRSGTAQPVWTQQQKLTPDDGGPEDSFGASLNINGDILVIGALDADTAGGSDAGAAYIFTRSGTTWTQQPKLTASDGAGGDHLGNSVAVNGDTIFAGAYARTTSAGNQAGATYIFTRNCPPNITAQTGMIRQQGSPASNSLIATVNDIEAPAENLMVTAISVPAGLTITNIANTNGTVTADVAADCSITTGANNITLQVSDGVLTATTTLTVNVTANTAPNVTYANVSVNAGAATTNSTATATDNGSINSFALQSQGTYTGTISVNASGVVSISAAAPVGAHTITIRAADNCGTTADSSFTLTVGNNPPTINAGAALTRQQGSAGTVSSIATVSDGETLAGSLVVTATAIPTGITVTSITNVNGTITANVAAGCNATVGANTVMLTVTDSNNGTATANLTVNVSANSAPSLSYPISGVALNSATTIIPTTATDNGSITGFSIVSVVPPLTTAPTINSSGVVSVTDAAPFGLHTITVRATDDCGATTEASFTLNVGCGSLTVNPATLINGLTFVPYTSALSATGGSGSYIFTLTSGTLPAGLNLSGTTISGTPNTAGASTFTIRATDDNGCFGERSYTLLIGSTGLMYYPLPRPVRLLDTRPGLSPNACFQPNAPIQGGTSRLQPARGTCEGLTIPPTATTITGNITTVQSGGGFLAIYPSDAPPPLVANSNYLSNEIVNNSFTVGVGAADGAVKISVTTDTDVVVDVTGYYAPPEAGGLYFHPLPRPVRLLETRTGFSGCFAPGTPLPGGVNTLQQGTGSCQGLTIPPEALALVGNATTVNPVGQGYLTLYPANAAQPLVASSNYEPGQTVNGPFTVGLSPSGQFNIYTFHTTELVIDITGYYSAQLNDANGQGLLYSSLGSPLRLLDTRAGQQGCYTPGAPMMGGTVYTQETQSPCTNLTPTARALIGNATAVNTTGEGYLTFWPGDAAQPLVATSNYTAGQVINRYFTVGLGPDGSFKRFAFVTTDLVIDISGFFAP